MTSLNHRVKKFLPLLAILLGGCASDWRPRSVDGNPDHIDLYGTFTGVKGTDMVMNVMSTSGPQELGEHQIATNKDTLFLVNGERVLLAKYPVGQEILVLRDLPTGLALSVTTVNIPNESARRYRVGGAGSQ